MKIKKDYGWAVLTPISDDNSYNKYHLEYSFTWDKKHPEEKIKKSEMVYAIYPTKRQAESDRRFRGYYCVIKKLLLK